MQRQFKNLKDKTNDEENNYFYQRGNRKQNKSNNESKTPLQDNKDSQKEENKMLLKKTFQKCPLHEKFTMRSLVRAYRKTVDVNFSLEI